MFYVTMEINFEPGNSEERFFAADARWYIFKPKIPILVKFGGPCNGRCS
jgi:hypothetical protein